ncbi:MAG TPA: response regulator transcription factor [Tepidisphaeraceae bacterium]|jgi:DNA-binding NarL/FixJ family response regulator|nr:response regulator transcription factor [Tepidisphaeraceae bacterium]
MKINILLADGRKLFREGLSLLLEQHDDFHVVGEAEAADDVPRLLQAIQVDVVVLNAHSPARLEPARVRSIRRARNGVRLIVLAASPPMELVQDLLDAGVSGCLTKECAGAELATAVRCVMRKEVYLSPSLVNAVVARYVKPSIEGAGKRTLAPREREILGMIAAGQSTKEIAGALGVSTKTIETHRRRIMEKLQRHSIAELTKYAVIEGLTSLETIL